MSRGGKVLVAIGLVLLLAAAAMGWRTYRFVSTGRRALGVVVRETPDTPGDRSPGHPLIAFTAADGRVVRAQQHAGADVRYGTRLPVIYAPANPQGAEIAARTSSRSPSSNGSSRAKRPSSGVGESFISTSRARLHSAAPERHPALARAAGYMG